MPKLDKIESICDFSRYRNVRLLPSTSASTTYIFFADFCTTDDVRAGLMPTNGERCAAGTWVPVVLKVWQSEHDTWNSLLSEAYIYQFIVGKLLATSQTPCLVAPLYAAQLNKPSDRGHNSRRTEAWQRWQEGCSTQPSVWLDALAERAHPEVGVDKLRQEIQRRRETLESLQEESSPRSQSRLLAVVTQRSPNAERLDDWLRKKLVEIETERGARDVEMLKGDFEDILFQVLWTLEVLHRSCLVHQDLHPGNILIVPTTAEALIEKENWTIGDAETWTRAAPRVRPLLFDWDRSALTPAATQKRDWPLAKRSIVQPAPNTLLIESAECCYSGYCAEFRPAVDTLQFIWSVYSVLLEEKGHKSKPTTAGWAQGRVPGRSQWAHAVRPGQQRRLEFLDWAIGVVTVLGERLFPSHWHTLVETNEKFAEKPEVVRDFWFNFAQARVSGTGMLKLDTKTRNPVSEEFLAQRPIAEVLANVFGEPHTSSVQTATFRMPSAKEATQCSNLAQNAQSISTVCKRILAKKTNF